MTFAVAFHINKTQNVLRRAYEELDPSTKLTLLQEANYELRRTLNEAWEDVKAADPKAGERAWS